jgi:hypothetical protein
VQAASTVTIGGLGLAKVVIVDKRNRLFRSLVGSLDVLDKPKQRDVSLHLIDLGGIAPIGWRVGEGGELIAAPTVHAIPRPFPATDPGRSADCMCHRVEVCGPAAQRFREGVGAW